MNLKILILWLTPITLCLADVQMDGSIRERFEYFDTMNEKFYGTNPKLGEVNDAYLLSRIRLGMRYQVTPQLLLRASLQDSSVLGWGFEDSDWYSKEFNQENSTQKDLTELHELFIQYQSNNYTLTLGRQRIAYGDYRVFGPGEWKNAGKWFWDAIKLSYKDEQNFLDIFYGATLLHDADKFSVNHRHGYEGAGVYGHYTLGQTGAIEPIVAYKKNDKSNQLYARLERYYTGFRLYDSDIKSFFYDMTIMKSFGSYRKLNQESVDSKGIGLHLEGGYHLKKIKTKVGLAYSYASGDNPQTKEQESFDAVFGASDKYYGRLNLFGWSNINDYELFAVVKPLPKSKVKLEYHQFYADEPSNKWKSYTLPNIAKSHYGNELDMVAHYNYSSELSFLVGAGWFIPSDYIEEASKENSFITKSEAYGLFTQVQYNF